MKKLLGIAAFCVFAVTAFAQQKPQYTQYLLNNYLHNPGFAGIYDYTDARVGYRNQWTGLSGAPQTFFGSVHGSFGKKERLYTLPLRGASPDDFNGNDLIMPAKKQRFSKHGIGGYIVHDQTGPSGFTGGYVSYAYHVGLDKKDKIKLAMGLTAGLMQFRLNSNEIDFYDNAGERLKGGAFTLLRPDLAAGVWLYSDNFYVGYSANQLLQNKLSFSGEYNQGTGTNKLNVHHFVTAGVKLNVSEDIALVPSTMLKYVNPATPSFDVNLRAHYQRLLWLGVSYRNQDAVSGLLGVNLGRNLSLGYSYDLITSSIKSYASGSHEIVLGVRFAGKGKEINPEILY
jgi:type IX secretion system PorP/SprF family membrane protein